MEIEDLRNFCNQLEVLVKNFNYSRIYHTYSDILQLGSLAEEVDIAIDNCGGYKKIFSMKDKKKAEHHYMLQTRGAVLLRAIYMFSDVFIKILLGEVAQVKSKVKGELSLQKFISQFSNVVSLEQQKILKNIDIEKLMPAYCVSQYRNKIIAHHDKTRTSGFMFAGDGNQCRLTSFPENGEEREVALGLSLSQKSKKKFIRLWDNYKSEILSRIDDGSFIEISFSKESIVKWLSEGEMGENVKMEILFYNIPIGELNRINQNRFEINEVAEEGLCSSMTRKEITNALDILCWEIIKVVS